MLMLVRKDRVLSITTNPNQLPVRVVNTPWSLGVAVGGSG